MKKKLIYFMLFLLTAIYSCLDTPEMTKGIANMKSEPSVVSVNSTSFPSDGALLFTGEVLSFGKVNDVFRKGFYWGFTRDSLNDSIILPNDHFEPGTFSYILPNAYGGTTYYWQAFARNDYGLSSGKIIDCRTPEIFEDDKDTFRGQLRSNFTPFTLNNMLYITCGQFRNALYDEVWRYGTDNKWYNINKFPGSARRNPVAFTIDDSLAYVGTGQGPGQRISFGDFYVFNGNTQEWDTEAVQTPAEMSRFDAVAFSLNNKGYVVGGNGESGSLNDVWEYSVKNGSGSWRKMNDFPKPFYRGLCFYDKKRVFAGFGANSETANILWEYDAENDRWDEFIAELPIYSQGRPIEISSGVIFHDKIYLIDITNIIWELDLETKKFKQKSTLSENFPYQIEQYMFSWGDAVYIGLGETQLFYKYNPLWDNKNYE